MRLQPHDLEALDAFVSSGEETFTRPAAVRAILEDWLATHGFLKHDAHDHPEPTGPATELIKAMDAAIGEHKQSRKKATNAARKR